MSDMPPLRDHATSPTEMLDAFTAALRNTPQPAAKADWTKYLAVCVGILTTCLTIVTGFAATAYWRSSDRLDAIEDTAKTAKTEVDRINRERAARTAQTDVTLGGIVKQMEALPNLAYRTAALETEGKNRDDRISRVFDTGQNATNKIADTVNGLSTKVEVLSSAVVSMQKSLERMEARRADTDRPFSQSPNPSGPAPRPGGR